MRGVHAAVVPRVLMSQTMESLMPRFYDTQLGAFVLGMIEFRSSLTSGYDDDLLIECYDAGRDFAHRITLRRFEER